MLRKTFILFLVLALALSGCAFGGVDTEKKQYQATFLTLFDTVTAISGLAESQEEFQAQAQTIHDALLEYHRLFDIYETYDGMNNLKTVNDQAGIAPVQVDARIIDLLLDCRALYGETNGRVNAAMGSVLRLWHDARAQSLLDPAQAVLPDPDSLREAAKHTGFDTVHIDPAASTVYLADPAQSLDVGAIAKGWAVERVCRSLPEGLLISVGGNVRATGPRPTDGSDWVVGVQKPDGAAGDYLHTLYVTDGSVVSSGDYQRYFTVDGARYHHIIDPDTLYPAAYWRNVTVLCPDSGLADALSTALFTLPREDGQALAEACGAEVLWLDAQGNVSYTPGFQARIRT